MTEDDARMEWKRTEDNDMPDLSPDRICEMARCRERDSLWSRRIAAFALVCLGGAFLYNCLRVDQPWVRIGQGWMLAATLYYAWRVARSKSDRRDGNETCLAFLVRSLEGKRRTMRELQWTVLVVVPAMLASWWGGGPELRARAMGLDPSSPLYRYYTGGWPFVVTALTLAFVSFAFADGAKKAARKIEGLNARRS